MKKLLLLLLVAVLTASALSSCMIFHKHTYASEWSTNETHHWRVATCKHTDKQGDFGEHVDSDGNSFCDVCNYKTGDGIWTQNSSSADGPLIWSPSITLKVVTEAEDNTIGDLSYYFYSNWGKKPVIVAPDKVAGAGQIIFGDLGYAISDKAYELLLRYSDNYELEENGDSAYLIYADGGSLAIAYTDIYSYNAAVDYIIDNLHDREYYASGVVESKIFNIKEFIAAERDKEREKVFVKLENTLGKEAVDSLKQIYNVYDEGLYIWLANLYEPNIVYKNEYYGGGFYYSNSARDYVGYLPDLESTGQAFAIIDNSGLGAALGAEGRYGGGQSGTAYWGRSIADRTIYVHNFLPAEMWEQLYTFATSLKAEDGYFYHPQWPGVSTTRRGRDAGWGNSLIAIYAKSTAASSDAKAASYISSTPSAFPLYARLGTTSVAQAVSKVVPTATVTDPELQSESAWKAYLDRGFANGSYAICHNMNSRVTSIKNAGLWDFTLTYLETHQKPNGLWEDEVTYDSISGLMKVSSFWGNGRTFPNADAAVESCMKIISLDYEENLDQIVYVYNPWVAMDNIIKACSDAKQIELRAYLIENAADLFAKTGTKIAKFKKPDGGFSYNLDSSAHLSQGALAAVEGTFESDVNATSIAISSVLTQMLSVFQIDKMAPKLFYEYDALYFLDIIGGLDAVIKKKLDVEDPINNTFEDYDESAGEEANGVVKYPSISSQMNIGNSEIGSDGNYKYIFSEIIKSPVDLQNHGNVLHVKDLVSDVNGNGKIDDDGIECPDVKTGGSNTEFKMLNHALIGNTYVLEMDMYCLGSENFYYQDVDTDGNPVTKFNKSPVMQIMFSQSGTSNHSVWVNLIPYEGEDGKIYIKIDENFAGADGNKSTNIVRGIPLDEWVNLRIETYKTYDDEGALSVRAKIFVNNVFVAETDSSSMKDGQYVDYAINSVKLAYYRTCDSEFYLDNVFVYKANTAYVSEQVDDSKVDTTVSAPSSYDFETAVTEGIYSTLYPAQKDEGGRESHDQTTVEIDGSRPTGFDYGVFFSIVEKPGVGKVLKVNSKNTGSAAPGVIELDAKKESGKNVHVIEYDFYYETNAHTADMIQLELLDIVGSKMGGATTITRSTSKNDFKLRNTTIAEKLAAGKWYKIRISIDSVEKKIHYHFSDNGGQTYYVATNPTSFDANSTIAGIRMIFNAYYFTGDVYLDNLNYNMAAEVPYAEIIVSDMAGVTQPTAKTTYDFTDGLIPVTDYFKATSIFGGKTYTAGTDEYNAAVAENGKSDDENLLKVTGIQYYVVDDPDPTVASNKVLQIVSNKVGSSSSTIDIIGSKTGTTGSVLELTFDYYMDYNLYTQKNLPILDIMFWDGQYVPDYTTAERRVTFFAQTTSDKKFSFNAQNPEGQETSIMEGAFKIGDIVLNSHTWYRVKVIISGAKQYTYLSSNGGEKYTMIAEKSYSADTTRMKYARLYFPSYQVTNRQYVDNISYEMKDTFVDPTK
ncbi:MAG: hypothetical protein E7676_06780 [Ruminococcaceae bacterium]|nr:hypothetical protein [Oscillospiraceae bacterium]